MNSKPCSLLFSHCFVSSQMLHSASKASKACAGPGEKPRWIGGGGGWGGLGGHPTLCGRLSLKL